MSHCTLATSLQPSQSFNGQVRQAAPPIGGSGFSFRPSPGRAATVLVAVAITDAGTLASWPVRSYWWDFWPAPGWTLPTYALSSSILGTLANRVLLQPAPSLPNKMPVIKSLIARDAGMGLLAKRGNWASQESGVIVVFCIVFLVASGLIALFVHKKLAARKAAQQQF